MRAFIERLLSFRRRTKGEVRTKLASGLDGLTQSASYLLSSSALGMLTLHHHHFRCVIRCLPTDSSRYRYWLEVKLAEHGPRLAVILKNPSTADVGRSDPTMGKVEAWARRQGYGSIIVVNLFARRSTEPTDLNRYSYAAAVGPENDAFIRKAIRSAETVIAAWGNPNGIEQEVYDRRAGEVMRLLKGREVRMVGGLTRRGYPRHGLRWKANCRL